MTEPTSDHVSIQPLVKWMFLLLFVILFAGALTLRYSFTGANNSDQVKQGNQISACRSSAHIGIDNANATVSGANTSQGIADSQLQELIATGFGAVAVGDTATTNEVIAMKQQAFARIDRADTAVDQAEKALHAATATYQKAVTLSLHDPAKFLRDCGAPAS